MIRDLYGQDDQNPYARQALLDEMAPQQRQAVARVRPPSGQPQPAATDVMRPFQGMTTDTGAAVVGAQPAAAPDVTGGITRSPGAQTRDPTENAQANQYGTQILDLYDDPYTRRGGGTGGIGSGALTGAGIGSVAGPIGAGVGAVVGGIIGAAKKHAQSAPTDFSVADAREVIRNGYRDMFGRDATDQEVDGALAGQGLKPGDHYVGEGGLRNVLGSLAMNANAERAATGQPPVSAATAGSGGAETTPSAGAAAPSTRDVAAQAYADASGAPATGGGGAGGGGGVAGNVEGVNADKWNDPNKHDTKYDVLHMLSSAGSVDAAWPDIQKAYPQAQRVGSDAIDFGDGFGPIDVQRDTEHGGPFHWEPTSGAGGAAGAGGTTPAATPAATPQLAPVLNNKSVLDQIMEEIRRIQAGEAPRNQIIDQLGTSAGTGAGA